jgi:hypothetical protein
MNPSLTMLVGRDEALRETLQLIGSQDFRATFLVLDSDVFAPGQRERWFGDDAGDVLVLLNDDVPERTPHRRWPVDAEPFDIGQAVLEWESNG